MVRAVLILLSLLLVFVSCTPKRHLTLSDLSFTDPDRGPIQRNNIDSLFIINQNSPYNHQKGQRIGEIVYDSSGRIIFDGRNWFPDYRYQYDSIGLLKTIVLKDFDTEDLYEVSYRFVPDSLVLYRINKHTEHNYQYTEVFTFNEKGQLVQLITRKRHEDDFDYFLQSRIQDEKFGRMDRDTIRSESLLIGYSYNDEGNLTKEEHWDRRSDNTQRKMEKTYYYSNRLDSVLTDFQWYGYLNRTYYDSLGLKNKTIYNDTLVVTYEYSTRDL